MSKSRLIFDRQQECARSRKDLRASVILDLRHDLPRNSNFYLVILFLGHALKPLHISLLNYNATSHILSSLADEYDLHG